MKRLSIVIILLFSNCEYYNNISDNCIYIKQHLYLSISGNSAHIVINKYIDYYDLPLNKNYILDTFIYLSPNCYSPQNNMRFTIQKLTNDMSIVNISLLIDDKEIYNLSISNPYETAIIEIPTL